MAEASELCFLIEILVEGPVVRVRQHLVRVYLQDGYEADNESSEEPYHTGIVLYTYDDLIYISPCRCRCDRCRRSHET